jgi:hypothetical protein
MIVPLDQHDIGARPRRGDRGGSAGGAAAATSTSQSRNSGTRRAGSVIAPAGRDRLSLSRPARNTSAWKNSRP